MKTISKMDPDKRKFLQKETVMFLTDMVNVEEVLDHLIVDDIITQSMADRILAERTRGDKARALHQLIQKRGKLAFEGYYKALRLSGNHDLADTLEIHIPESNRLSRPPQGSKKTEPQIGIHVQETQKPIDEPDLPEIWPDVTLNPLDVHVRKCDANDSYMNHHFENERKAYSMVGKKNGVRVLIINNEKFGTNATDTGELLEDRHGSDTDVTSLEILFNELGLTEVKLEHNLSGQKMFDVLKEHSGKCKRTDNAFICVILSSGNVGRIYGVDGVPVPTEEIVSLFDGKNCPNLQGKPKIFFLQACQGGKKDGKETSPQDGFGGQNPLVDMLALIRGKKDLKDTSPQDGFGGRNPIGSLAEKRTDLHMHGDATDSSMDVQTMVDILVASATTKGYVSWRNSVTGSWFIQALVYVIQNFAFKCDLLDMLSKTNNLVTKKVTKHGHRQCCEFRSTFNKKFYFFPGFEEDPSPF